MRKSRKRSDIFITIVFAAALLFFYRGASNHIWSGLVSMDWFVDQFTNLPRVSAVLAELASQLPVALMFGFSFAMCVRNRPVALSIAACLAAITVIVVLFGPPSNWLSWVSQAAMVLLVPLFAYFGSQMVKPT